MLATTYGFPIELTQELAEERGQAVDIDRFRELMEEHREVSRAGGESTTEQLAAELVGAGAPADASSSATRRPTCSPRSIAVGAAGRHAAAREARGVAVLRRGRRPGRATPATSRSTARTRATTWSRCCGSATTRCSWSRSATQAPLSDGHARARGRRLERRASRRRRTTPRRTCCTRRCARCSATTSSRPARPCAPTSCASTSRTPSRSRRRSASASSGSSTRRCSRRSPCARS